MSSSSQSASWTTASAGDIMRTEVLTVAQDAPLSEVERLLGEHRIGGLPVTNEAGRIVGVVSMRDLIERYAEDSEPRKPGQARSREARRGFYDPSSDDETEMLEGFSLPEEVIDTAGDIMTDHVFTVGPHATLSEIAAEMVEHNVHRILVTEDGRKIGFISTMDILRALAGSIG